MTRKKSVSTAVAVGIALTAGLTPAVTATTATDPATVNSMMGDTTYRVYASPSLSSPAIGKTKLDLLKFYEIVETNEGTFKDVGWGWAFVG